ncbi:MAG: CBS domain-containing protein [bacterium]|nr:CBS domain-containing protein [bacterium]
MSLVNVQDIMTKEVISVHPDMPLLEAAKILSERNFDGVPVVDTDNKLVGILTEYDLISKESMIHLPTFQKILQNIKVFKKDQSEFQKEIQEISLLVVRDVMNTDPLTLGEQATFMEVLDAFRNHHRVNPIPVIDSDRRVVGVVSRFDILKPLHALS